MKHIILISCSATKLKHKSSAVNMYQGTLFKYSLRYARMFNADIYILSALYGLLALNDIIEPYNVTLSKIPKKKKPSDLKILNTEERANWGIMVLDKLQKVSNLKEDTFTFFSGKEYIDPIRNKIHFLEEPLKGKGLGTRIKFLKDNIINYNPLFTYE